MKKFRIIAVLFFIVCIAAIIAGAVLDKGWLSLAGMITLFGVSFLTAVIASIVVVVKAVKGVKDEDDAAVSDDVFSDEDGEEDDEYDGDDEDFKKPEITERDLEEKRLERINSTTRTENQIARAEYMMSQSLRAAKSSTVKEKALGTAFLVVLLLLMFGGIALVAFGFQIAGFILIGGFAAVILIAIITVVIKQKLAMSIKRFDESNPQKGRVISCTVSSQSTTGSRNYTRVTSTTYKLKIDVNGTVFESYSKTFYSAGDNVTVFPSKNGSKYVYISEDLSEEFYENESDLSENGEEVDEPQPENISSEDNAEEASVLAADVEIAETAEEPAQNPEINTAVRKPRKIN